jgi:hypothetical protein
VVVFVAPVAVHGQIAVRDEVVALKHAAAKGCESRLGDARVQHGHRASFAVRAKARPGLPDVEHVKVPLVAAAAAAASGAAHRAVDPILPFVGCVHGFCLGVDHGTGVLHSICRGHKQLLVRLDAGNAGSIAHLEAHPLVQEHEGLLVGQGIWSLNVRQHLAGAAVHAEDEPTPVAFDHAGTGALAERGGMVACVVVMERDDNAVEGMCTVRKEAEANKKHVQMILPHIWLSQGSNHGKKRDLYAPDSNFLTASDGRIYVNMPGRRTRKKECTMFS